MKLNKILLILIILLCLFMLTGCYNSDGVETKAYVIAIGIDKRRKRYPKIISPNCYTE